MMQEKQKSAEIANASLRKRWSATAGASPRRSGYYFPVDILVGKLGSNRKLCDFFSLVTGLSQRLLTGETRPALDCREIRRRKSWHFSNWTAQQCEVDGRFFLGERTAVRTRFARSRPSARRRRRRRWRRPGEVAGGGCRFDRLYAIRRQLARQLAMQLCPLP